MATRTVVLKVGFVTCREALKGAFEDGCNAVILMEARRGKVMDAVCICRRDSEFFWRTLGVEGWQIGTKGFVYKTLEGVRNISDVAKVFGMGVEDVHLYV